MRSLAWFVVGCLVGGMATTAVFVWLVLEEPVAAPVPPPIVRVDAGPPCPEIPVGEAPWTAGGEVEVERPTLLEVPRALERRVQFWEQLWGQHPDRMYVFIDRRRPWVQHGMVDCRPLFAGGSGDQAEKACDQRLIAAKRRMVKRLRKARKKPPAELLKRFDRDRKLAKSAYRNITVMKGLRDHLDAAWERGRPYLDAAERVFLAEGLPPALAKLAIIESLFEWDVVSDAGAVGAYQFVAGTARSFLRVDGAVDERLDPLRSSWAAARYLKQMHAEFASWPLTLTAYNTGPTRLRRLLASSRRRDLATLVEHGTRGNFGFDGQNYFAQLAAVVRVTADRTPLPAPPTAALHEVPEDLPLARLAECLDRPLAGLADANPALAPPVTGGELAVPKGYLLALPPATESETADGDQAVR